MGTTYRTLTAKFKEIVTNVNIYINRENDSGSSVNAGHQFEYITLSSDIGNNVQLRFYGDITNNTSWAPPINYPLLVGSNTKTLYKYFEWLAMDYEGNFYELMCTPYSFDLIIEGKVVLSNLKSPTSHTLFITDFDGKSYTTDNYEIIFTVK